MMRTRTDENAKLQVQAFLTELSELTRRTSDLHLRGILREQPARRRNPALAVLPLLRRALRGLAPPLSSRAAGR